MGRALRRRASRAIPATAVRVPTGRRVTFQVLGIAAILLVITVIAYLPAMRGGFVWDDDDYVTANATLRSVDGLRSIWLDPAATPQYYPLVHTSFWLEYRLWQLAPHGYHVTNLVLHLAGAVLLWRILVFLAVPGAWLTAAIFAVHPVHVESVAWITERKNVLSGVFYFSSMLAYLHFALDTWDTTRSARRARLYAVACGLFVMALLSKTVTATLPAALLLLIVWRRGRVLARDVWPLVPLFVVGVMMGLVTVYLERHHVGAQGIDWQLSWLERGVIAGRALWFYVAKLVWPVNLTFIYPRWQIDAASLVDLAYPLGAIALIVGLWFARPFAGTGPVVAVLFFAGTLVPALGFFDVFPMRYTFVADHYQYLASVGLIALAVGAATTVVNGWLRVQDRAARSAAVLVVVLLAGATWHQSHAYADHETLWRDTIRKDPMSWMGHTTLGALLERRGALVEAERHYREAIRINPTFGIAHHDLGALLANQGRYEDALPHMREAVRLTPTSLDAHLNLGRVLLILGRPAEAARWLQRAADGWPQVPQIRGLLEQALAAERLTERPAPASASPAARGASK